MMDIGLQKMVKLWLHPDIIFYNTAVGKKVRTCISYMDNITRNIIKGRKEFMLRNKFNRKYKEENSGNNN
ncbi:cytochrome P450 4C1-like isoform X1 [Vespula squamosa]|uniref:Cytochrome P450 4C1-like isoform X1 n=1 Tax=Vespula squamosa TaxID=30214 RepID=A0ABD2BH57_VESSQ